MPRETNHKNWLMAQIALQQDMLKTLTEADERKNKEGQIALKKDQLSVIKKIKKD